MPIVEVNGEEYEFPDSMSEEEIKLVLRKKFSSPDVPKPQRKPVGGPTAEQLAKQDRNEQLKSNAKSIARGVEWGGFGVPALIGDATFYIGNKLTGQNLKPPFGTETVDKSLVAQGLPKQEGSLNNYLEAGASGFTGGAAFKAPVAGLTSALSSETAKQAGFGPVGQVVAGIGGAAIPSIGKSIVTAATAPPKISPLAKLSSDQPLMEAVKPSVDKYTKLRAVEGKAWSNVNKLADVNKTTVSGKIYSSIRDRLEGVLGSTGQSIADSNLVPIKEALKNADKYGDKVVVSNILDQSGKAIKKVVSGESDLGELLATRRNFSNLAGKSTDPAVRSAAGKGLTIIDEEISSLAKSKQIDPKIASNLQRALELGRTRHSVFGTNKLEAEKNAFERIVTKTGADATELNSVMASPRMTEAKEQLILRSIETAGNKTAEARKKFADYFINQAIEKSSTMSNGKRIIDSDKLRVEIENLVRGEVSSGGIGAKVRNAVFDREDLGKLETLYNNLPKMGVTKRVINEVTRKATGGRLEVFNPPAAAKTVEKFVEKRIKK